jgi:hypothetical protein
VNANANVSAASSANIHEYFFINTPPRVSRRAVRPPDLKGGFVTAGRGKMKNSAELFGVILCALNEIKKRCILGAGK